MPKPRKLRLASIRIRFGTSTLNRIIKGAIILGRICRVSILGVEQPIASAACTYTFSLMPITAPLIILEPVMPHLTPETTITCHRPGPNIAIKTIRRIKPGMHITASTNLCTIRSNLPPKYPLSIPINAVRSVAIVAAAKPTIIETRAPKMTRLSMSRPRLSVPNQYLADGGTRKSPT
ncbi:hypothetical protein ES703_89918 [subsurface metagenome]